MLRSHSNTNLASPHFSLSFQLMISHTMATILTKAGQSKKETLISATGFEPSTALTETYVALQGQGIAGRRVAVAIAKSTLASEQRLIHPGGKSYWFCISQNPCRD